VDRRNEREPAIVLEPVDLELTQRDLPLKPQQAGPLTGEDLEKRKKVKKEHLEHGEQVRGVSCHRARAQVPGRRGHPPGLQPG
jgi:hypothetical protein